MRRLASTILILLAASVAAGCGSKSSPKPLALKDRVLKEGELRGFTCYMGLAPGVPKPPCARPIPTVKLLLLEHALYINNPRGAFKRLGLQSAGFVRATAETFFRKKGDGEAGSATVQFTTTKQAKDFLDRLLPESLAPCPTACQVVKEEFDVAEIDGARGVKLSQTTGPKSDRFVAYRIDFADGVFVYQVGASGPLGGLSQDDVVAAAKSLDDRVKGRPPA
jgi:hypothetical protein